MHKFARNNVMRIGVVVLFLAVLGYVIQSRMYNNNVVTEKITVRLGWEHQAQFAGFYVAQAMGFYEDVGLDVELRSLDLDKDQVAELQSQEVDISIMEAHQLLAGVDVGADIRAVAAIYQVNPHALAVRQDSDIREPADFAGKTIGLAGGEGEGNVLFEIFAEQYGGENIQYVNLGFDTVDDFANNRADIIDVYRIDQPYLAKERGIPLHIISLDAYGFSTYGDIIAVNEQMLNERPDVVRRFVQASLRGWELALRDTDTAVASTLAYTTGNYDSRAYQEHIVLESIPLVRGEASRIGYMEFVPWSILYESMKQAGALTGEFDLQKVYTNMFIQ